MKRRRTLSNEERRLWSDIARTARPLPGRSLPEAPDEPAATAPPSPPAAFAPGPSAPVSQPLPVKAPGRPKAPPLHPIERPVRRKLGRGHLPIEDRIDLHGRTEAVAHYVLLGFLRQAQARGLRHVLVITGRGASFGSTGVLKRALPHWFSTPEFRGLVAGFEAAERRHGGDGAVYVRVRRP